MALSEKTAAQRAFLYAQQKGAPVDANFIPRAIAVLPDALRDLAERVAAMQPSIAELLRKTFAVTLVAGSADLTPHTTAAEPMLPHRIIKVEFPGLAIEELRPVADEADLDRPWPNEWAYYAVYDNTIGTLDPNGDRMGLDGTANVRAGYVPLIENVPAQLQSLLIEILAGYELLAMAMDSPSK